MCGVSCSTHPYECELHLKPRGDFDVSGDVYARVKHLVLDGRLAPFEEGLDTPTRSTYAHATTCALDLEECPICCLSFPSGLNRSRCCGKEICSNCYFRVKTTEVRKHYDVPAPRKTLKYLLLANCPYCKCKPFEVDFVGKKSAEDRERELREERTVSEALRKKIEEDTANGLGLEEELSALEAGASSSGHGASATEIREGGRQLEVIVESDVEVEDLEAEADAAAEADAGAGAPSALAMALGGTEKRKRSSTSGSSAGESNSSLSLSPSSFSSASSSGSGSDCPLAAILPSFPGASESQQGEIDRLLLNQAILESFHNSRNRDGRSAGSSRAEALAVDVEAQEEGRRHRRTRSCPLEEGGFDLMNPFAQQQQQRPAAQILLNTH
uniref:RING-type domain-containing protein n=1 Tax=Phaeocystis cordata TaxID=118079 RepID=A0A7S1HQQ6_9EUKA|mmetsp:Transcript_2196/g.6040  ORF Transcript_2196/g.6040 Transcript_2196/m.6040 type:complete len:385 (-) Transcript_2196:126-1280(-)